MRDVLPLAQVSVCLSPFFFFFVRACMSMLRSQEPSLLLCVVSSDLNNNKWGNAALCVVTPLR